MLRLINSLKNISLDGIPVSSNLLSINVVRWRKKPRKPMWKGTAKSKLFRVPIRPQIPEEEALEIQRLYNNYRTQMKTITKFLTLKYNVQYQQQEDQDLKEKEYQDDLNSCMKLNNIWNNEQKLKREARAQHELNESIRIAENRKLETEMRRIQRLKDAEEIVRREKKLSVDFILPEMLDRAIEIALANPVDHNFALDINGNKIIGREATEHSNDKGVKMTSFEV